MSERNLQTKLNELNKLKLLIIDELRYLLFFPSAPHLLCQLINRRYESKSTIITSNRSPGEWGSFLVIP
ncbi:MAG: ATP-binding protein [Burkholderiaceae bacterium]|nr:ATP-binding protein [Burkholderiaceae bacterium]